MYFRTFAVGVSLALTVFGSVRADDRSETDFNTWRLHHEAEISVLKKKLDDSGVSAVRPLNQILRSASDWKKCGADAYSVPPAVTHLSVVQTLKLIQQLEAAGAISPTAEIVSGYRPPALAKCASSTVSSAHTTRFAADLVGSESQAKALCTFWKREGARWKMGLSKYPSGRIHIDVTGYRTWGADCTCETSYCQPCKKSANAKCIKKRFAANPS